MSYSVPARASASQMGKPVSIQNIVPGNVRHNFKHKIYWSNKHHKTAEQFNAIAENYQSPCFRRWLEFIGGRVPRDYPYPTTHAPPPITSNPLRTWTLVRGTEEIACYTNCIEAWLLCVTGNIFQPHNNWSVIFRSR